MPLTPGDAVADALARLVPDAPARLGVAVSGGSDSLALMHLLHDWARARDVVLCAATVDHGLRAEAAAEAAWTARHCAGLGVAHDTLTAPPIPADGNLQANARRVRYRLLRDWAGARRLGIVCLGHTQDDQAETVLLRLARGSGVDGLAGMAPVRTDDDGPIWVRPCLDVRRAALRDHLTARGVTWCEDPGNADTRFDRIKARRLLSGAGLPGMDVPTLAATAVRMAAARQVLASEAAARAREICTVAEAEIAFDHVRLADLADDTRWRLLAAALCRVSGRAYRPRLASLKATEAALAAAPRATLHGCLLRRRAGRIWIGREPAAAGARGRVPGDWDARWRIAGPADPDLHVAALGEDGLAQRPGWRAQGVARATLLASPGVWRGPLLVAAPRLDADCPWRAEPLFDTARFIAWIGARRDV